ncbi:MAG: dihydrolipoyl dehydrogenase, partial [Pseudomonadota bacterium]|nr:dihydrolipoyl dehydrogenase [Pseudomonadota bacterium]
MAQQTEVKVPDIGDYDGVPVIELLVAVGDRVEKDQGLVTLESDKATMEVPAPEAGVIRELRVKLGDSVAEGAVIAVLETEGDGAGTAGGETKAGKDGAGGKETDGAPSTGQAAGSLNRESPAAAAAAAGDAKGYGDRGQGSP